MALMYDMETVNKTMQTAASFVASGGTEREKYILNTFAGMKPRVVELALPAQWIPQKRGFQCSNCGYYKKKRPRPYCSNCGANMDGGAADAP